MAATLTKIDRFDGGMVNDPREQWNGQCRVSKHFDVLTDPHRMVPYLNNVAETKSGGDIGDTEKFVQMLSTASTLRHYALGVVSGTTRPKIFERTPTSGDWAGTTNGEGANTGRNEDFFIEYNDALYFASGTSISALTIGGSITEDVATMSSSTDVTCPPIIHSLDDILYGANDNVLFKKDGGAVGSNWNMSALTLPLNLVITSVAEFGIYLAIGCRSKYSNGKSVVFLWDRDSSVNDLTARIDWGTGDLRWVQELDGVLIGATRLAGSGVVSSRIVFKFYDGRGAVTSKEILASSTNVLLDQHTIRTNKRIYFMMAFGLSDRAFTGAVALTRTILEGVFAISIKRGRLVLTHERVLNNNTDTALTTGSDVLHGFFLQGDTVSVMYTESSAYVALQSNITGATLTASSLYESLIFNGGDTSVLKKLLGVSIFHEPIIGTATVTVAYKRNAETAWTDLVTSNTANDIQKSTISELDGSVLPQFTEIQFRINSTNGAVITGLLFAHAPDKRIYG